MGEVAFSDIARAVEQHDPGLGELLVRYMAQEDPEPGLSELAPEDADAPDVPEGAWTLERLGGAVGRLRGKTATERRIARRDAFDAAAGSAYAPPRLGLGRLLVEMYGSGDSGSGDAGARDALITAFREGELGWGAWQGAKAIYKLAEASHDAALFGVLASRFDTLTSGDVRGEVSQGTLIYMRRRAWRWLRQLGRAVPELFPSFAVEVLRHYPAGHSSASWVATHIWSYETARLSRSPLPFAAPAESALKKRAFPAAWKLSPAPMLRLLDLAENEVVCTFAIRSLKVDHPLALRAVEPAWLARLGARPIGALHAFVVALIRDNPELHASRLAEVGLHDTVVGFLRSPDAGARAYALDYVRGNVPDLPIELLFELLGLSDKQVVALAVSRFEPLLPTLSLPLLARLLTFTPTREAAGTQIRNRFRPADLTADLFVDVIYAEDAPVKFLMGWYNEANVAIPVGHWQAGAVDSRRDRRTLQWIMQELGKRKGPEIGIDWIRAAIDDPQLRAFALKWLQDGKLAGPDLDVEWIKGFVARPSLRAVALSVLANRKLVAASRIGVDWLLGLAGSSDPELQQFGESQLLQGFAPNDFASGGKSGLDRLWELAVDRKEPVRQFASTWLRVHHPDIGPHHSELKTLGIKPLLKRADYPLARVRPLFEDERPEPRRLAAAIGKEEMLRWNDPGLLWALAGSRHREARALGCELLLGATVDPPAADAVPPSWIDGQRLFLLAESAQKQTRETVLTVIRALYDRVGSPERLTWLMESADRDVRLFAVRLFWDRYRPIPGRPTKEFADVHALRQFLRAMLYGLPPGRVERRGAPAGVAPGPGKAPPMPARSMPVRPMSASVGKRRLVEAVRDLGSKDAGFARVMVPVLAEFTASEAKGEWQACVAALATLKAAHGAALDDPR